MVHFFKQWLRRWLEIEGPGVAAPAPKARKTSKREPTLEELHRRQEERVAKAAQLRIKKRDQLIRAWGDRRRLELAQARALNGGDEKTATQDELFG